MEHSAPVSLLYLLFESPGLNLKGAQRAQGPRAAYGASAGHTVLRRMWPGDDAHAHMKERGNASPSFARRSKGIVQMRSFLTP